jgi:hypothetical protein
MSQAAHTNEYVTPGQRQSQPRCLLGEKSCTVDPFGVEASRVRLRAGGMMPTELTKNQLSKVRDDISRILREKPNVTVGEIFERLNRAYTGVTLSDIKSILKR